MLYFGIIIANNGLPQDILKTFFLFILTVVASSSVFSWNQIFDAELDRITTRKTSFGPIPNKSLPIASKKISKGSGLMFSIFLFFISIVLAYLIDLKIVSVVLLLFILSVLYSTPPIRLKSRTPLDAIINAIGFGGLVPLLGFVSYTNLSLKILLIFIPSFTLTFGIYIPTTIVDYGSDKKFKLKTFATEYGIKNSAKYSFIFQIIGIIALFLIFTLNFYRNFIILLLPFSILFLTSTLVIYFSPSSRTTVLVYSPALLSVMMGLPIVLTLYSVL
jgi:4-hydroxybenzoate polyprenyltransferase